MNRFIFLLLFSLSLVGSAQSANSFAVFVDNDTYQACEKEISAYKESIEKHNGLTVYVLHNNWENPEQIKSLIDKYYREQALEGIVLIGNIPVPMIRRAQHLASAFKMDEENYPMAESSVPSDRFYDDLALKFDFIKQDSVHTNFYYYNLRGDSPQQIVCSIYSGRIKPSLPGEQGFQQIRKYLTKAVAEKAGKNKLDKLLSFSGEGSVSNSLAAWKDEAITLKEQIPAAFTSADGAKFYSFYTSPDVREFLKQELRRDNLDLALFHGHGLPERQYLTGEIPAMYDDDYYESGLRRVRQSLRNTLKRSPKNFEKAKESFLQTGIDSTWFAGLDDPKVVLADSLWEISQVFTLEDIAAIQPNVRVLIFDACYNGDFREENFVADQYIFSEGKTIACIGNSANVLQDKSSSDLLGMLACGYSIGEWYKNINILESHIIGDPTYRFASEENLPKLDLHSQNTAYWKEILSRDLPPDLHSLALYKLDALNVPGTSELLLNTFQSSPYYTQRLQALQLLSRYNDSRFSELVRLGLDDPHEYIRRKSLFFTGKIGRNDFIPDIVNLYLNDYLSKRIAFNLLFITHHFPSNLLKFYFDEAINQSEFIFDKEAFLKKIETNIDRNDHLLMECNSSIIDRKRSLSSRLFYISVLRNNPFPQVVDDALLTLRNREEDPAIRVALTEALGWYTLSLRKENIIAACADILKNEENLDPRFSDELQKTINRLTVYSKK